MPSAQQAEGERRLYVGYLPMPRRHVRTLPFILGAVLWIGVGVAAISAWRMSDPGAGVWNSAEQVMIEGVVVMRPYPLLMTDPESQATHYVRTLVLVELGKRAAERAGAFDGQRVRASGWLLERDGRRMLELAPDDPVPIGGIVEPVRAIHLGPITVRGEIVDYKCYLGAMKPGDGAGHRACAALCIRGGIPPVLITRGHDGTPVHYMLISADGGPFNDAAAPFIATPVEVSGDAEQLGDLNLLRVRDAGVTLVR